MSPSLYLLILVSSFPLNPSQQGMGSRGSRERGLQGPSDSGDHHGQELLLTEQERRGGDGGEQMSAAAARLCVVPPAAPLRSGSRLWMGSGQVQRRAGGWGGLGPVLRAPSLSSFVRGANPSNRAVWRFRWECGSLWGRRKRNSLRNLQNVPFSTGTERWRALP